MCRAGTPLDRHDVLPPSARSSRPPVSTRPAGHPGELRHSFVSLLSDSGMSIEEIACCSLLFFA
jgi:hypothetical protein